MSPPGPLASSMGGICVFLICFMVIELIFDFVGFRYHFGSIGGGILECFGSDFGVIFGIKIDYIRGVVFMGEFYKILHQFL